MKGNDMFLICVFSILCLAALFAAVTYFYYECKSRKLLKAHQQEWDLKKNMLREMGALESDIEDAYMRYCDRLMKNRGLCGACLPKR